MLRRDGSGRDLEHKQKPTVPASGKERAAPRTTEALTRETVRLGAHEPAGGRADKQLPPRASNLSNLECVSLCICERVCVCARARAQAYLRVRTSLCVSVCLRVSTSACLRAHACVWQFVKEGKQRRLEADSLHLNPGSAGC